MDAQSADQDRTTSAESPEPRRGGGTSLLWLFALPVLYILSAGPAAKLDQTLDLSQHHPALERGFEIIYAPVGWCAEHSSHFRRFMDWYGETVWHLD